MGFAVSSYVQGPVHVGDVVEHLGPGLLLKISLEALLSQK